MKKLLFMFLLAAAVASAFTFVVAADENMEEGKKFVIHGEIRERADFSDNLLDFTSEFDDSFLIFPYRARIGAEGHFGKNVVGYVEFQNFGEWGDVHPPKGGSDLPFGNDNENNLVGATPPFAQDVSTGSFNEVQMYQGWIALNDIRGSNFSLKFGRQEIVKGSEMLLGDKDFYAGLSHDGAMGTWNWDKFNLDVWWTRPSQSFDGSGTPDHQNVNFYGAWVDWAKFENQANVSAYALYYEDGRRVSVLDAARRAFWTIGGRTGRDVTGRNAFNWNAELAYQTGDQQDPAGLGFDDTKSIKALAFEGMLEYNLHSGSLDHRFHVSYVSATGDNDPTDQDAEAFDPLFQDSHARYGYSDLFQLSDLNAVSLGYNVRYHDSQFGGDVWSFKLAEDITVGTSSEDDLGSELDLWWKYQYSKNAQVTFAGAWFKPGNFIDAALAPISTDNGTRLYGNLRLRF